jgi:hypothetical protein
MAGRRWAEGKGAGAGDASTPRPSERKGAGPPAPGKGKGSGPAAKQPSAEVMARARSRLAPPPAPWHPLPLSELAIALGAVAMIASVVLRSDQGLIAGFLLILLGTAEFSWREHRHGHRSHGALLAGTIALPVALAAWKVAGLGQRTSLVVGAVVFFVGWSALNSSFRQARERKLAEQHGSAAS